MCEVPTYLPGLPLKSYLIRTSFPLIIIYLLVYPGTGTGMKEKRDRLIVMEATYAPSKKRVSE